jgi:ketosteroid isomerase-like protein
MNGKEVSQLHLPLRMRRWIVPVLFLGAISADTAGALAQSPAAEIKAVLQQQAADWNRGDMEAFASGYKNSPDILFISRTIERGYAGMLAGYKAHYPTRDAMGTLSFSQLEVQPLDARFATTTGHFHLERTAKGGGNADGYFLLVLEKTDAGWKVVRDDTTALPPSASGSSKRN